MERKMIYQDDAIDAIVGCTNCGTEDELRAYVTKHSLENGWTGGIVDALDAIEQLPSEQPEIVRCRDCKHWKAKIPEVGFCVNKKHVTINPWKASDYCSHAERKDGEQDG